MFFHLQRGGCACECTHAHMTVPRAPGTSVEERFAERHPFYFPACACGFKPRSLNTNAYNTATSSKFANGFMTIVPL